MEQQSIISNLTIQQKELLRKKIKEQNIPLSLIPIEPQYCSDHYYDVSADQQGTWYEIIFKENTAVYNIISVVKIYNDLDVRLMQKSLNILLERHEALRTTFHNDSSNNIKQHIHQKMSCPFQVFDLMQESEEDTSNKFNELLDNETNYQFKLDEEILIRASLFQQKTNEVVLLVVMNHIISDGWSMNLFLKELLYTYTALIKGEIPRLPELKIQPKDYAAWQNEWLKEDLLKENINYWKNHLKDAVFGQTLSPDLLVQTDSRIHEGGICKSTLEGALLEQIKSFSKNNNTTLYIILLTTFKLLLSRYLDSPKNLIGTVSSGRNRPEVENLIGYFINVKPLYTNLDSDISFIEAIRAVSQALVDLHEHRNVTFNQILDVIEESKTENFEMFNILFLFQNSTQQSNIADLTFELLPYSNNTSKKDLVIEFIERDNTIDVEIGYNLNKYKHETIKMFLEHYFNLLNTVLNNPEQVVSELIFLAEDENNKLLNEYNQTKSDYPKEETLSSLFDETAKHNEAREAIRFNDESITYSELKYKTDVLAGFLIEEGVKQGDFVGIYMNPSIEQVVSVLAIMKIGCAYVPLDPSFPANRIKYIIDYSNIKHVLIKDGEKMDIAGITYIETLKNCKYWNRRELILKAETVTVTATSLAYILHTSGSTGQPKGVMVTHQNVVNFLYAINSLLCLKKGDKLLSVTTFSFDISVLEIFLPLLNGAILLLTDKETRLDGKRLLTILEKEKPEFMQATPATWTILLASGWTYSEGLTILCGGENLRYDLAKKLLNRGKTLWNLYGPTETTIWSLAKQIREDDEKVTIGKPIGNTTVYVLDSNKNLLPIGQIGDLHIGGQGVSAGYLNQPQLTSERFVKSPFTEKDEYLFNTGDKVRFIENGELEYIGREDQQVKIRGFRIEMAEIEIALNKHKEIQESVVVVKKDSTEQNVLAAYIKRAPSSNDTNINLDELRDFLRHELPEYMIPSHFLVVEDFPQTPNKKIDKKKLSDLSIHNVNLSSQENKMRSETEKKLVSIWAQILNKSPISIYDNFFNIGGHSILAMQLITEINRTFRSNFHIVELIKKPRIADFATLINPDSINADSATNTSDLQICHDKDNVFEAFPLTEVQQAYVSGRANNKQEQAVSTHIYHEVDVQNLDLNRLEEVLNVLIKRHPMLRAIFLSDNSQIVLSDVPYYTIIAEDLSLRPDDDQDMLIESIRMQMSHETFQIDQWPLFNIKASIKANKITSLHMSFDLLIADAWSFQILLAEIAQLYSDKQYQLKPIEISFRDYVVFSQENKGTEKYMEARSYWLKRLSSMPLYPQLPLENNLENISKRQFKRYKKIIPKEIWQKLVDKTRQHNITKTSFLLACFSEVLTLWSQKAQFTLNLTFFNRLPIHEDINNVIGDFTSISLLEVDTLHKKSFLDFIKNIHEQLWNDLEYNEYSGIRVTEDLLKKGYIDKPFPVIFTSMLDLQYSDEDLFSKHFEVINTESSFENSISQTPQVWLDHQVIERNGHLCFNWDVVDELFPEGMIDNMFECYCKLLEGLSSHSDLWLDASPLASYRMANPYVSHLQNICTLHRNTSEISTDLLHTGFFNQVSQAGEMPAIINSDGTSISYKELDNQSGCLSELLLEKGVKRGEIVAVVMDKSWHQIASSLGILRIGAAYLPIDSNYPSERISQLLRQSQCRAVIIASEKTADWHSSCDVPIIISHPNYLSQDYTLPSIKIMPEELAYVIYTSGSTGVPKGVMIDHRGAVNTINDINTRFDVKNQDRVLAISSHNFDLSVYDIFGILSVGGSIVIPDFERLRDPSHWADLISTYKVSIWNSVPALMKMLCDYLSPDLSPLRSIRLAMLSGDWIPVSLADSLVSESHMSVTSLGGATEASIWSIIFPITHIDPRWTSIPYGISMINQEVRVLNDRLDYCPEGVMGDLYIVGTGLSLGYFGDPELSADRFFTHPVSGDRLYRTGDLGRYMFDGQIEFLGRVDSQVKIGGYRIELGEIESVLNQNPYVDNAVVVVNEDIQLQAFATIKKTLQDEIISDPSKRLEFKLDNKATRKNFKQIIELDKTDLLNDDFLKRRSFRYYMDEKISFSAFSNLLGLLRMKKYDGLLFPRYLYASAGGTYPVRIYIYIKPNMIETINGGYYYYNPEHNALCLTAAQDEELALESHVGGNEQIAEQSAFSIFLVSNLNTISPLYGEEHSKMYGYIEAGLISQLLEMKAPDYGIGLCQIGAIHFDQLRSKFDLSDADYYLHTLLGGKIDESQLSLEVLIDELLEDVNREQIVKKNINIEDILKEYLLTKLPDYMVPKQIAILKSMLVTNNGKIDRKALINMDNITQKHSVLSSEKPQNQLEVAITEIWKELLNKESIDRLDSFFDLGGNSFKVIEMHKQLKALVNKDIPIVDLFRYSTIDKLTTYLLEGDNPIQIDNSISAGQQKAEKRIRNRKR